METIMLGLGCVIFFNFGIYIGKEIEANCIDIKKFSHYKYQQIPTEPVEDIKVPPIIGTEKVDFKFEPLS